MTSNDSIIVIKQYLILGFAVIFTLSGTLKRLTIHWHCARKEKEYIPEALYEIVFRETSF